MTTKPPTPERGENKPAYLRRCVAALRAGGMDGDAAFAACALEASRHTLGASAPRRLMGGRVRLEGAPSPEAPELPKQREPPEPPERADGGGFAILAYTGAEVCQWDYRFVIDLAGLRMAHNAVPALREHDREAVVGMTERATVTGAGLLLHGRFLPVTGAARQVRALAEAGFPWQASIGVMPLRIEEIGQGQSVEVNGRVVAGPLDVWREARVDEISFVALGADGDTAAVAMRRTGMPDMSELERTEERRAEEERAGEGKTPETPDAAGRAEETPDGETEDGKKDGGKKDGSPAGEALSRAEGDRLRGILRLCGALGLDAATAHDWVARGLSLAQAREAALTALERRPGGQPVPRGLALGEDESDRFRRAAVEGLCLRQGLAPGPRGKGPEPGAERFRALGPLGLARLCLSRAGERAEWLSASEAARRILSPEMRLAAAGQDYAAIFADVMHKFLLRGYEAEERTFLPLAERMTATDFRDMHGVSFSADLDLAEVPENGEYAYASPVAASEKFRVAKYGRILRISWEQIVNDDLSAFSRLPAAFGAAWGRKQNDIFYAALTTGLMADGKPLADAAHNNLVSAGTGVTSEALARARRLMRQQRGLRGERLNIAPTFLVVPPSQETAAEVLLHSLAQPEAANAAVYNPWASGRLRHIVEPRLEADTGPSPWYVFASPAQAPVMAVSWLNGEEGPTVTQHEVPGVDGLAWKVRGVFGVGPLDWRGVVRNDGASAL